MSETMMKVIAFYLPQYHIIPENDLWWGDGFTEWSNLKKAQPMFKDHMQPVVPLNQNYYDLSNKETLEWQIELAKKYGVYGFCVYHYWFCGKLLLERPMEIYLNDRGLDFPFCFSWANESWSNAWSADKRLRKTLIQQRYGNKDDWIKHFQYLLPFLRDDRYIKVDGKPLLVIYRPEIIECLEEMLSLWKKMALNEGLGGLCIAAQRYTGFYLNKSRELLDYFIEYQPDYAQYDMKSNSEKIVDALKHRVRNLYKKYIKHYIGLEDNKLKKIPYDKVWDAVINRNPISGKMIPGAFVGWDNTPRYGKHGKVFVGKTPEVFEKYMEKQIYRARYIYDKDMLFLFAWNEWTEGGYLEPDEKDRYRYLEAVRNALEANPDGIDERNSGQY